MFIFLINFRKKPKFGANFDEIAIFGMKLQNFGRWRLISALDMSVFSCESSSRGTNVRSSVRSFVRQDTLTLTAYKSLCRFRTYKCEVSLEPYTQGLLI